MLNTSDSLMEFFAGRIPNCFFPTQTFLRKEPCAIPHAVIYIVIVSKYCFQAANDVRLRSAIHYILIFLIFFKIYVIGKKSSQQFCARLYPSPKKEFFQCCANLKSKCFPLCKTQVSDTLCTYAYEVAKTEIKPQDVVPLWSSCNPLKPTTRSQKKK